MTKSPRQEANDSIDENNRCNRPVREYVISNGNFQVHQVFNNAVIDSFVMAAKDNKMSFFRKLHRGLLIKPMSSWGHQHHFGRLISEILDGCKNRLRFHHHSLAAAKWCVVHNVMFVFGPV